MKKGIIVLILMGIVGITMALAFTADPPDVIQQVSDALKTGSSSELSKHFNPTVEMEILGEENIYSKAQSELLLKDFFNRNKPTSFKVNHQGTKGTTSFAIGILVTSTGNYRVSVFLKTDNGKMLVHQIRIEDSDESLK